MVNVTNNIVQLENNRRETKGIGCRHCLQRSLCLAKILDDEGLSEFEAVIHHSRPLSRRQSIVRAGDLLDRLYFVRSGTFKSYRLYNDGTLHVTGFHLPGEIMGLDDISAGVHNDYIESLEVGSVCELSLTAMGKLISVRPALMKQLLGSIGDEIHREIDMTYLLGRMNAEQKLASFLLNLTDRSHRCGFSADSIQLSMTRGDIANYLGMAVETISRVFQRLRNQGILQIDNRSVKIVDRKTLEAVVTSGKVPSSIASAAYL